MTCSDCNRDREKYAKGLCSSCYDRQNRKRGECGECGQKTCRPAYKMCLGCLNTVFKPRLGTDTSDESRKKMSASHIGLNAGENHPNWKGGLTDINTTIRRSWASKVWRKTVMELDDYTCAFCKIRGGNLEVHHIKRFSEYPELRFDITNGITLCKDCHDETKGREEHFEEECYKLLEFRLP